jgi:hypothetical protein
VKHPGILVDPLVRVALFLYPRGVNHSNGSIGNPKPTLVAAICDGLEQLAVRPAGCDGLKLLSLGAAVCNDFEQLARSAGAT